MPHPHHHPWAPRPDRGFASAGPIVCRKGALGAGGLGASGEAQVHMQGEGQGTIGLGEDETLFPQLGKCTTKAPQGAAYQGSAPVTGTCREGEGFGGYPGMVLVVGNEGGRGSCYCRMPALPEGQAPRGGQGSVIGNVEGGKALLGLACGPCRPVSIG